MSLHAELLVRVLTDGAIHFIRPDLEGEGQCGRRAGLDEVRLPLDALPFDLESVWDAPRVGDGERDGPCRDRGLRQLHLPLGELGGHRRGRARGSVRGGRCKCDPRQQDQGDVAGRNSMRVCDNSFPRRWRPHAPGAYSFGNNPAARGVLTRWRTAHPEDRLESSELERFEAVVLAHLDAAYTLARYLTRSDHDAQDVVQDASLRAFRHFGSFRGAGSGEGRAWLLAIVRNTAYTWQRRHHGDTLTTAFDEEQHSEAVTGEDPEAAVVAQGERVALHRAIDELPPEFREVIVLRELEELSYKEIAEVAGVPVGTVMSRLARARRRLEEVLCAQTEDC